MHKHIDKPLYENPKYKKYVPGSDPEFVLSEYDPRADEVWHLNARIKLARAAETMSRTLTRRHDAVQTAEYHTARKKLNQLEIDIQLHDTHGTDHGYLYGVDEIG